MDVQPLLECWQKTRKLQNRKLWQTKRIFTSLTLQSLDTRKGFIILSLFVRRWCHFYKVHPYLTSTFFMGLSHSRAKECSVCWPCPVAIKPVFDKWYKWGRKFCQSLSPITLFEIYLNELNPPVLSGIPLFLTNSCNLLFWKIQALLKVSTVNCCLCLRTICIHLTQLINTIIEYIWRRSIFLTRAFAGNEHGSDFLQSFSTLLQQHYKKFSLDRIFLMVKQHMGKTPQVSTSN